MRPISSRISRQVSRKNNLSRSHHQKLKRNNQLLRRNLKPNLKPSQKPNQKLRLLPSQLKLRRSKLSQLPPHQHQRPIRRKSQNKKKLRSQKPRLRPLPNQRQRKKKRNLRLLLPRLNRKSQQNNQRLNKRKKYQNRIRNRSHNLKNLNPSNLLIRKSTIITGTITTEIESEIKVNQNC